MSHLGEILDAAASRDPRAVAVAEGAGTITYGELCAAADRGARRLADAGIGSGSRVGLLAPNSSAFVAGFFAAVRAGAVVVPLHDRAGPADLDQGLAAGEVDALIAARELRGPAGEAVRRRGRGKLLDAQALTAPEGEVRNGGTSSPGGDAPVLLQFSSGSTGTPKRVLRTHGQLLHELAALREALGLIPADRFLGAAPFSHVNGLVRSMLASLYAGAALHPLPRFDRRAAAERIEAERIAVFIAVPFMFAMLAEAHWHRVPDFRSLRLCVSASAPLPAAHNRRFHDRFGRWVRQLYGCTEAGSLTVNLDPSVEESLESVGKPLPGVAIAVLRDDGTPADRGETGEVLVRSPAAITSYLDAGAANRESFREGWFVTGDLGVLDAGGRLTLLGRKKLQINRGGHKVDPVEVERVLEEHPAVAEAGVVGVPSPYGDDRVKAVVVLRAPCDPGELVEHCRARIADYKVPGLVEFRDALPRSPAGKLLRALLSGPGEG